MRRRSVEGFTRAPRNAIATDMAARAPVSVLPKATSIRRRLSFAPRTYAKPKVKVARHIPLWIQMLLISLATLAIGSFAGSTGFGQIAVAVYGVIAFVFRIASRTTFVLAVLGLGATTWMLVMQGNVAMAQNFATYTFLLLVVGVFTLSRELKKEGGRIYNSRKTPSDS